MTHTIHTHHMTTHVMPGFAMVTQEEHPHRMNERINVTCITNHRIEVGAAMTICVHTNIFKLIQ